MIQANGRFFTNDRLILGSETCERLTYPRNQRPSKQQNFTAPTHTVDSQNLFVYVNGRLQIKGRDYTDENSTTIKFTVPIDPNQDVDIVLVLGCESSFGSLGTWDNF